jgi:ribosome maturation factor RimP
MDTAERIRGLVAPLVAEVGAEIYDIEFSGGTLAITVDQPGGVGIDVIGSLSRSISHLLDDEDPIPGQYTLEVSSPGLERPLRRPEHYQRSIGSQVTVKTRPGTEGERRVAGTLAAADGHGFTVESPDGARRIEFDDVERARTVFEWGPKPKPGGRAANPSSKQNQQKKAARS